MGPTKWNPCVDPREDLEADHGLWARLLPAAYVIDGDKKGNEASLFWSLQGLRSLGAKLERKAYVVRLSHGEIPDEEYQEYREQWLRPHSPQLVSLLTELGERLYKLEENQNAEIPA